VTGDRLALSAIWGDTHTVGPVWLPIYVIVPLLSIYAYAVALCPFIHAYAPLTSLKHWLQLQYRVKCQIQILHREQHMLCSVHHAHPYSDWQQRVEDHSLYTVGTSSPVADEDVIEAPTLVLCITLRKSQTRTDGARNLNRPTQTVRTAPLDTLMCCYTNRYYFIHITCAIMITQKFSSTGNFENAHSVTAYMCSVSS